MISLFILLCITVFMTVVTYVMVEIKTIVIIIIII